MSTEIARGVHGWDCPAGIGHPICIASLDGSGESLSVNVYLNDDGDIAGVCVYRDVDLVAAAGELPLAVIDEERLMLGREPITLSALYPADMIKEDS